MSAPRHVAIIMDGNGRWAQQRGLPRFMGHRAGGKVVQKVVEHAVKKRIQVLTLFAFSTENSARPEEEVSFLMDLFIDYLCDFEEKLVLHKIKLTVVGDRSQLQTKLRSKIEEVEEKTVEHEGLHLVIAVYYSGRWDLTQAMQQIAKDIESKQLSSNVINSTIIERYLSMPKLADPDLLIRTSGEQRISNFMLWQLAYTELYFTSVRWPSFTENDFDLALASYAKRERRFGLTAEAC